MRSQRLLFELMSLMTIVPANTVETKDKYLAAYNICTISYQLVIQYAGETTIIYKYAIMPNLH